MIVTSSIVILLVTSVVLVCTEAAEFPPTCNGTTWSLEQNVNGVSSAQKKEEIIKLKCALGCKFVVRIKSERKRGFANYAHRLALNHWLNIGYTVLKSVQYVD